MRLSLVAAALVAASAFGPNALALDEICTAAETCVTSTNRLCDRLTGSCPPCVSMSLFGTSYTCVNRTNGRCPNGVSDCTATTTPSPTTVTPTPTVTTKAPNTTAPPTSAPPTTEPPTEAPTIQPPVDSASASASGSSAGSATEAPTTTKPPTTKAPKTTKPATLAPETEAPTPTVTETLQPQNETLPASDVQNNSSKQSSGLKLPVILGIVAGGVVVIAALAFLIWKRNRDDDDDDDDDDFGFNKPAYTARAAGAGGAAAGAGAASASAYGSNPVKTTYAYSSDTAAPTSPTGAAPGLASYPASRFGANRYGRYGSAKYSSSTDYGVPSTMFMAPGGHADAARGSLSGSNSSSEDRDVWGNSTHTNSTTASKKAASPATPLGGTREARSDSYEF